MAVKKWTAAEIDYIKENYGLCEAHTIAASLGRTKKAIQAKAHILNLTSKKATYWPVDYDIRILRAEDSAIIYERKNITREWCRRLRRYWCKLHMEKLQSQEWIMSIIHNL